MECCFEVFTMLSVHFVCLSICFLKQYANVLLLLIVSLHVFLLLIVSLQFLLLLSVSLHFLLLLIFSLDVLLVYACLLYYCYICAYCFAAVLCNIYCVVVCLSTVYFNCRSTVLLWLYVYLLYSTIFCCCIYVCYFTVIVSKFTLLLYVRILFCYFWSCFYIETHMWYTCHKKLLVQLFKSSFNCVFWFVQNSTTLH